MFCVARRTLWKIARLTAAGNNPIEEVYSPGLVTPTERICAEDGARQGYSERFPYGKVPKYPRCAPSATARKNQPKLQTEPVKSDFPAPPSHARVCVRVRVHAALCAKGTAQSKEEKRLTPQVSEPVGPGIRHTEDA